MCVWRFCIKPSQRAVHSGQESEQKVVLTHCVCTQDMFGDSTCYNTLAIRAELPCSSPFHYYFADWMETVVWGFYGGFLQVI